MTKLFNEWLEQKLLLEVNNYDVNNISSNF